MNTQSYQEAKTWNKHEGILFWKSIKQTFKRFINDYRKAEDNSALLDVFSLRAA